MMDTERTNGVTIASPSSIETGKGDLSEGFPKRGEKARNAKKARNMPKNSPSLLALHHLCGPAIILVAVSALLVPIIVRASAYNLLSVFAIFIGVVVTAADGYLVFRKRIVLLRNHFCRQLNRVVLDDVLKGVFSLEYGAVPCAVSTLCGAAGMANLPLSDEHRARIMQWAFELPSESDAKEALTVPGGVTRLLPEPLQEALRSQDMDTDQTFEDHLESEPEDGKEGKVISSGNVSSVDLSWDADGDSRSTIGTMVDTADGSNNEKSAVLAEASKRDGSIPARHAMTSIETRIDYSETNPGNLDDVLQSVIADVCSDLGRKVFSKVDERVIRFIGIMASVALILQLRASRTARRVLLTILHGSATVGLTGVAMGAIALLEAKRHVGNVGGKFDVLSSNSGPTRTDVSPSNSFRNPSSGMCAYLVHAIEDKSFRQRLQSTVAMCVLIQFGRTWRRAKRPLGR